VAEASEVVLGRRFFLLGADGADDPTFTDFIFGDVEYLDSTAFIQKFPEIAVPPSQSRTIVHYYRSTWGISNYASPYGAVVDAPQLVAANAQSMNGLRPNPMTIRVYVDNVAGYAGANTEIPLSDVKVSLNIPEGIVPSPGEPFVDLNSNQTWDPGEPLQRTIATVPAKEVRFVDFSIEADGIVFGDLGYSVKIEPIPGPTKILEGIIQVATTPRISFLSGANLVTLPWTFTDTSWEAVLGMQSPTQFQAYKWDPQQNGYVPSTSVERGRAAWIVINQDLIGLNLQSNPQTPPDIPTGMNPIQLKSGWNLIGNPYPYPIKLGELVGVSGAAPSQSYPWLQLVAQGFVGGALVYWDGNLNQGAGDYVFIQGGDAQILPNRGYWAFVPTVQDLTISYPAVFVPGLPGSNRSSTSNWAQTDRQWRLQLAARTDESLDTHNYVGITRTAANARDLRVMEPPMAPVQDVGLSIEEVINGQPARVAQSFAIGTGRKTWRVFVETTKGGTVTLTWPNLSTLPHNVQFRLTDRSTGETRNLRRTSGYSFTVDGPSSREITIEATPGSSTSIPVIGNVIAAQPGRGNNPITISYTLSTEATTTVRILSGSGREVFTITRGRADGIGENSVTWALKDNANRVVAPGTYRVEILAESATGERVRKVIPINVIR
jgi:hypothetical protein